MSKKRMMLAGLPGNFNQALARSFLPGQRLVSGGDAQLRPEERDRRGAPRRRWVIRDFYGTVFGFPASR